VNLNEPAGSGIETKHNGAPPGPVLVIAGESLPWRRRVGPLAWTALQHLALSSHHTDQGWAVAAGVRDIAVGLGVTKDTAARAVSTLVDTGLVSRARVQTLEGRQRSGYLLHLPRPIRLIADPDRGGSCPEHKDKEGFRAGEQPRYGGGAGEPYVRRSRDRLALVAPARRDPALGSQCDRAEMP
jgi:hypothetical protein